MADKHTCRGCGKRTRLAICPECGRMWRPMGEILGNDAHDKLTQDLGKALRKHYPEQMAALDAERAQNAREPVQATATQPAPQTGASGENSTLGDRMAWTIAPKHMHPGAEPLQVIQPEQWRQPSWIDDFGEWLDAHPSFTVAWVCLCIGLCAAAAVMWGS